MSEELSRVKSRTKNRHKKNGVPENKSAAAGKQAQAGGTLSRPRSKPSPRSSAAREARSRTEAGRSRGKAAAADPARQGRSRRREGGQEGTTPSRSSTHSSERIRLSKLFVNSLIFLFIVLLGALLVWGIKGAPPLSTLW